METINIKKKLREGWDWTKRKVSEGWNWTKNFAEENKEFLVFAMPIAIGGFKLITKVWKSAAGNKAEKDHKELYVWDNRVGQYWRIRRPLRVSEQLELERRRNDGEPMGEILASMRVL